MPWTLLTPILRAVFTALTPVLKKEMDGFALSLYRKAKSTPNPADDVAAAFLLEMLGLATPTD